MKPGEIIPVDGTPGKCSFCPTGLAIAVHRDGRQICNECSYDPKINPFHSNHRPEQNLIFPLVHMDLRARDEKGRETYGQELISHDGRDPLQDAYEECLDLAVYLRKAIYERDGK